MSRCFPYPPPGYLRQGGLVESIKLERERVLPKTEQKLHKKREEEEKKKEKKEKDKSQGHAKKLKKLDDVLNGYGDDQLEKSDLTEEHEPPVCYTSDGTQNSHKRKRETVPTRECKVDGTKIQIRFSFKKPRVSDASIGDDRACSSSVRADSNQEQRCTIAPLFEQNKLWLNNGREESIAPVPEQNVCRVDERKEQRPSSSLTLANDIKIPKPVWEYKTLIEDWMPPLLQDVLDDDNGDDWLLPKKQLAKPVTKMSNDNDVTCRASATLYPRAHFLPQAEIYALPYTVPF